MPHPMAMNSAQTHSRLRSASINIQSWNTDNSASNGYLNQYSILSRFEMKKPSMRLG